MSISQKSNFNRPICHEFHRDWKDDRDLLEEIASVVYMMDGPYDYYQEGVYQFRKIIESSREKGYEDNKYAYLLCQWIRKKLDELMSKHGSYHLSVHTLDFPNDFEELITQEDQVEQARDVEAMSTANDAIGVIGFEKIKDMILSSQAFAGKESVEQNFSEDESDERDVHHLLSVCSGISEPMAEGLLSDVPDLCEEQMGSLLKAVRIRNSTSPATHNSYHNPTPSAPIADGHSSRENIPILKDLIDLCEQQLALRNAEVEKNYDPKVTDLWIPKWGLGIEFRVTWSEEDEIKVLNTLSHTNSRLRARDLVLVVPENLSDELFEEIKMIKKREIIKNLSIIRIVDLGKYLDRFESC